MQRRPKQNPFCDPDKKFIRKIENALNPIESMLKWTVNGKHGWVFDAAWAKIYDLFFHLSFFFFLRMTTSRDIGQYMEDFFPFLAKEFYYSLKYGLPDDQYELWKSSCPECYAMHAVCSL